MSAPAPPRSRISIAQATAHSPGYDRENYDRDARWLPPLMSPVALLTAAPLTRAPQNRPNFIGNTPNLEIWHSEKCIPTGTWMKSYRIVKQSHLPCRQPDVDIGYGAWVGASRCEGFEKKIRLVRRRGQHRYFPNRHPCFRVPSSRRERAQRQQGG